MTIKKSGSDKGFQKTGDREKTWLKTDDATRAIKELIRSMKMNVEQKITLEDGINNLAKDVHSRMDRIDMAWTATYRKKLRAAYQRFLEYNIEVVNKRLKQKD